MSWRYKKKGPFRYTITTTDKAQFDKRVSEAIARGAILIRTHESLYDGSFVSRQRAFVPGSRRKGNDAYDAIRYVAELELPDKIN